jgi:hypothetical protein
MTSCLTGAAVIASCAPEIPWRVSIVGFIVVFTSFHFYAVGKWEGK